MHRSLPDIVSVSVDVESPCSNFLQDVVVTRVFGYDGYTGIGVEGGRGGGIGGQVKDWDQDGTLR